MGRRFSRVAGNGGSGGMSSSLNLSDAESSVSLRRSSAAFGTSVASAIAQSESRSLWDLKTAGSTSGWLVFRLRVRLFSLN